MLTIVTSFNKSLWERYARSSVKSWLKHLKGDYRLVITVDGPIPSDIKEVAPDALVISLDNIPEYKGFLQRYPNVAPPPNVPPEHKFRFEYKRFWPKVMSMKYVKDTFLEDWKDDNATMLWLDADVMLHKDLEVTRIEKDLTKERTNLDPLWACVILDRGMPWGYCDSGYALFSYKGGKILNRLYNLYETGCIFHYRESHDAYLLSRVIDSFGLDWYKENVLSLSGREDTNDGSKYLNPMEKTWLNGYATHFKGNRK